MGGGRDLGRLFSKTLGYYVLTSALAIFAGLFAVNLIQPGVGANIAGARVAGRTTAVFTAIPLACGIQQCQVVRCSVCQIICFQGNGGKVGFYAPFAKNGRQLVYSRPVKESVVYKNTLY